MLFVSLSAFAAFQDWREAIESFIFRNFVPALGFYGALAGLLVGADLLCDCAAAGVTVTTGERLTFRRVPPPTVAALEKLIRGLSERVGRTLERQGLLVRDL